MQDVVVWHEKVGLSPDEIIHQHPTISLADIHAALAYYWDHREEIERAVAEECAVAEALRQQHSSPFEEKLKRRRRG